MKRSFMVALLFITSTSWSISHPAKDHQVGSITVTEIKSKNIPADPSFIMPDPGKIIAISKEIVALGEQIYALVQKGKPNNVSVYSPVSVVPKEPGTERPVGPFELEGFSTPIQKTYSVVITNAFGKEVVTFIYQVIFSHSGSYDGKGKYLTGVIVVPKSVKVTYGWDFNATMKLANILNHGTKESPVVGVMLTLHYKMSSLTHSFERNDTIHITGRGELTNFGIK